MKFRFISAILALLFVLLNITSCFSDDEEVVYSGDCIITSVTLGTLNRTIHTKNAAGKDSTYQVNVTGALYPLHIDHLRGLIYNTDSLPVGTNLSKVVFSSFNASGSLSIRSLLTGQDTIFVYKDSLDYTTSRVLTVHSSDGISRRSYLLSLNVHKEEGDSMLWTRMAPCPSVFEGMSQMKAAAANGNIYIIGRCQDKVRLLVAQTDAFSKQLGNNPWKVIDVKEDLNTTSIVYFGKKFYATTSDRRLLTSDDAQSWTAVPTDFQPEKLVGCGQKYMIAYADGAFYSSVDTYKWLRDEADQPEFLPDGYVSGTCISHADNPTFETFVVVGKQGDNYRVWRREVDLTDTEIFPWIYLPETENSLYNFPRVENFSFYPYDKSTLMTGMDAEGHLAPLTLSYDNGRTWNPNVLTTPTKAKADGWVSVVDQQQFVWLISAPSGDVWRGRINRLGWKPAQDLFEKSSKK